MTHKRIALVVLTAALTCSCATPASRTRIQNPDAPNPFGSPSTALWADAEEGEDYIITIYNIQGEAVRTFIGTSPRGGARIIWDGTSDSGAKVTSGVYFYKIQVGEKAEVKKMILIK